MTIMKIKTYCKTITFLFRFMKFDFDRALISFKDTRTEEELFFCSRAEAREAYLKIIDGIESDSAEVDLTEYIIIYGSLHIKTARETLRSK